MYADSRCPRNPLQLRWRRLQRGNGRESESESKGFGLMDSEDVSHCSLYIEIYRVLGLFRTYVTYCSVVSIPVVRSHLRLLFL